MEQSISIYQSVYLYYLVRLRHRNVKDKKIGKSIFTDRFPPLKIGK